MDEDQRENRRAVAGNHGALPDRTGECYQEKPYLAGDSFSRADLAAASLFAPMFQPGQYPVPWPKPAKIPKDIQAWLDQWQPQIHTLEKVYAANR
ncbi:hypothetical protein AU15_02135 [Marinobacter salarius]|uniref:Glutathione S-transferase n=1 Tax=Marinobacter salarius TaxID=1420917 RepID=W5YUS3_9GAMM|nr:hypothetical protein AU15_02135 [Marinobacter salarius]